VRSRLDFCVLVLFIATIMTGCVVTSGPGTPGSASSRSQVPSTSPASSASAFPAATSAVMPAACRTRDLGARFQGGGYGGGNDIGSIQIWNAGATNCRLAGAVTFAGFFANGATDPEVQPNQPLPPLTVTLPAHMRPAKEGADPTPYLVAFLDGPERDDPTQPSGLCRPQDELTPATLDLSIGDVTLVVPNQDPAAAGLGEIHAVYGCHGRVLLEDVTAPQSQ
jgi:hypothetical protein